MKKRKKKSGAFLFGLVIGYLARRKQTKKKPA